MSDEARVVDFSNEKAVRIVKAFMDTLRAEDASAGEACAAASFVFKQAMENAPTLEERAQIRAACIDAMDKARPVT